METQKQIIKMEDRIFIHKIKNKHGKDVLLRGIKFDKKLSFEEQFAWVNITNCMLNLNMTFEQVLENELYNNEVKNLLFNVYNLYLKDIIDQYKIKKENKTDSIKIRVTLEEKRTLQIQAKNSKLSVSDYIRKQINLNK